MMLALLVGVMIIEDNDDDNSDNDDVERTGEMLTVVPPAIMIYVYRGSCDLDNIFRKVYLILNFWQCNFLLFLGNVSSFYQTLTWEPPDNDNLL